MSTILKYLLILALILPNVAGAKPCGDGYIRDDYECHQDDGGDDSNPPSIGKVLLVSGAVVGTLFLLAYLTSPKPESDRSTSHGPNVQRGNSFESFVQDLGGTVTVKP